MKKRNLLMTMMLAITLCIGASGTSFAAFNPNVENAYNLAVQAQDALDGLDVTVEETTISSLTNIVSERTTDLKVSGISSSLLYADITITTDESSETNYYRNGYYYETVGRKKVRVQMDRNTIWNKINSLIYLDMNSTDLTMLYSMPQADGNILYQFAADEVSLGDYADKLLDAFSADQGAVIDNLQGSMLVDAQGHVLEREISLIYSVDSGDSTEIFHKNAKAKFKQNGTVQVALPDLSAYQNPAEDKPIVTLTACNRTVYALADLNVRAAGSLEAAVIGGYSYASGMTQTAYTSDGWVQIQYNGGTGYVYGQLVGTEQPVTTKDNAGIMYAICPVNVRESWNSDSLIKGVLGAGESVEITGTTSNGWTRVRYNGERGYVYSDYLSWSEPVDPNYVENASLLGPIKSMSYGIITVERPDGTDISFNTSYAAISIKDTIEVGDMVTVIFSGSSAPYTASKIMDTTVHTSRKTVPEGEIYNMDGIISELTKKTMTVSCMDGTVRAFDLTDATIKTDTSLSEGNYVVVKWASTNAKAVKDLQAILVS